MSQETDGQKTKTERGREEREREEEGRKEYELEAGLEDALSDALLHLRHRLAQLLRDRLSAQRLHVEVVRSRRENQERNDRRVRTCGLKANKHKVIDKCQGLRVLHVPDTLKLLKTGLITASQPCTKTNVPLIFRSSTMNWPLVPFREVVIVASSHKFHFT